ncbi:hypothetical protein DMA12_45065 [Amycolatopsis balhimycina DSM 5908]|uniref:CobW/HypB/UreG nucleotide-binding domain-containing protein n=1 Tax=Amycolatopsis balhimycina DSM 5908 TaxID=1081091 RepID=A0A428VWL9_AMYBA|nr:GTP-binding protein [Amycolatopsis balhimycina]RSM35243.1 hypothetical protein DMA12_45065 [Amycolatopsis balhimycina DSM 5908]
MTPHPRVPLVLVSGLAPGPNAALAELLRVAGPGTAVVHHDLREIHSGVVRRQLRLGEHDELSVLELAHGCVSCTLREDLLPLLRRLARRPEVTRIVVRLDEAMEPEPVSWAIRNVLVGDHPVRDDVDLRAVLTVVDCATWLADATGDDELADRNLQGSPEDERTVAQVALSQVEFADVLVLAGAATDAWSAAKASAVLDRVAPSIPRVELARMWTDVSPERHTLASLRWDPAHGDRAQELVVVTDQTTPDEIDTALRGALLTDEELAAGPGEWQRYPDPFGDWHEEPCEDTEPDPARHDATAANRKEDQ